MNKNENKSEENSNDNKSEENEFNSIDKLKKIKEERMKIRKENKYKFDIKDFIKAKYLAKKNNIEWNLTLEEFIKMGDICNKCGEEIFDKSYFIKRKDNNIDYNKDNCILCCKKCNIN